MVFNKVQVFLTMDPNTQRKNFTNNKLILQASCTFYPMCLILADWNSKSPFIQEMLVACFPLTLLPHNVKKYLSTLGWQWLFIILKNELGLNWKDFQTKKNHIFLIQWFHINLAWKVCCVAHWGLVGVGRENKFPRFYFDLAEETTTLFFIAVNNKISTNFHTIVLHCLKDIKTDHLNISTSISLLNFISSFKLKNPFLKLNVFPYFSLSFWVQKVRLFSQDKSAFVNVNVLKE